MCGFITADGLVKPTMGRGWIKLKDGVTRVQFRLRARFHGFKKLAKRKASDWSAFSVLGYQIKFTDID
jgi:hypothetical protein